MDCLFLLVINRRWGGQQTPHKNMTEIERLNKWLEEQGKSPEGKFWYRLVWSNKILEYRRGLFRDFIEGTNILIREVVETRLVRKYNYIHERWVLEKWAPGNLAGSKEVPESYNGDYLPVYVFDSSTGVYLKPTEKVLKFIIDFMNGRIRKDDKKSQQYFEDQEINDFEKTLLDSPDIRTFGPTRNSIAYTKGLKNVS
jgi:hypothetical protein